MALLPLTTHAQPERQTVASTYRNPVLGWLTALQLNAFSLINCLILTFQTVRMPHGRFLFLLSHWTHLSGALCLQTVGRKLLQVAAAELCCVFSGFIRVGFGFILKPTNQFNIPKGRHVV